MAAVALFVLAIATAGLHRSALSLDRKELPAIAFADEKGRPVSPAAFKGKVVLLSFWATWCAPCREEIPALDRLQSKFGGRGLEVAPVSIDLKGLPAVDAFYAKLKIEHLRKYLDDTRESAKTLGLNGVPSTLLLDRNGHEVWRVERPMDWDGEPIAELLTKLLNE